MFNLNLSDVKMSLYNVETGEKILDADDVRDVKLDVNTKYETRYDEEDHKFKSKLLCSDYEMTFNCDTSSLDVEKLFGVDMATKPDAYDITYIKIVPCRTHKKKRINKKWLKRYGYKQVRVTSKGWQLNTYIDGSFEFKKDIQ
jgi:hypothetical protein